MPILAWITRRGVQNLAQQDQKSAILFDSHMKQREKHQHHDKRPRTAQLLHLAASFNFLVVNNTRKSTFYAFIFNLANEIRGVVLAQSRHRTPSLVLDTC